MTVEQAVADFLADDADVAALVSTRVFQLKLPQGSALPAIRVQHISALDHFHLRGGSIVVRSRVQTDVYADEASGGDPYDTAARVAAALHDALNGSVFVTDDETLKVTGAFRDDRRALYEPGELRIVRILQDYIVWSRRLN